jgi:hypothetical protein
MTCSVCQSHMCYICRAPITTAMGYAHFCQTPFCTHQGCNKCPLYTDPIEDDRRAMRAAALQAKLAQDTIQASSSSSSSSSSAPPPPALRFTPLGSTRELAVSTSSKEPDVDIEALLETATPAAAGNAALNLALANLAAANANMAAVNANNRANMAFNANLAAALNGFGRRG